MRTLTILIALFFASQFGFAQKGKPFPKLTGETFDGKAITVPDAGKGKATIIGICFNKDAEGMLRSWANPMYNMFLVKRGDDANAFNAAMNYDVNYFFIPRLNLLNRVWDKKTKEKMKEDTDKEFWPYIIFCTDKMKDFKKEMGIDNTDVPYFFVLDKNGVIKEIVSGGYSDKKMGMIEEAIDD